MCVVHAGMSHDHEHEDSMSVAEFELERRQEHCQVLLERNKSGRLVVNARHLLQLQRLSRRYTEQIESARQRRAARCRRRAHSLSTSQPHFGAAASALNGSGTNDAAAAVNGALVTPLRVRGILRSRFNSVCSEPAPAPPESVADEECDQAERLGALKRKLSFDGDDSLSLAHISTDSRPSDDSLSFVTNNSSAETVAVQSEQPSQAAPANPNPNSVPQNKRMKLTWSDSHDPEQSSGAVPESAECATALPEEAEAPFTAIKPAVEAAAVDTREPTVASGERSEIPNGLPIEAEEPAEDEAPNLADEEPLDEQMNISSDDEGHVVDDYFFFQPLTVKQRRQMLKISGVQLTRIIE